MNWLQKQLIHVRLTPKFTPSKRSTIFRSRDGSNYWIDEYNPQTERFPLMAFSEHDHLGMLGYFVDDENWVNLADLFVREQYRRKGVATALLKQAIVIARREGHAGLYGRAVPTGSMSLDALLSWYRRMGFELKGATIAMPLLRV